MAQIKLFEETANPLLIPLKETFKKKTVDIDSELKFETFLSQQKKTSGRKRDVIPESERKIIKKEEDSPSLLKKYNTTSKTDSASEETDSEEELIKKRLISEIFLINAGIVEVPVISIDLLPREDVLVDSQSNALAKEFLLPITVNLPIEIGVQQKNIMETEKENEKNKLTPSNESFHFYSPSDDDQGSSGADIGNPQDKPVMSLTTEEQKVVDQFLKTPTMVSESGKNKSVFFSLTDERKGQRLFNLSSSLTPIPNMHQVTDSQISSSTYKREELNQFLSEEHIENLSIQSLTTEENSEKSASSNQQKNMDFSQSFQQKMTQNIIEQTKILTTNLSNQYAAADFISQLKDQFEKFKNSNDKKLTVHIRDGSKNLTILFNMHDEKGINVVFRTTDHDWKKVLEKHKDMIEKELHNIDNHHQLDIRYIGE